MATENIDFVQTTEKTLRIINLLVSNHGARIKDISKNLDMAQSTALRHLKTLENHGYVDKDRGVYRPGWRFLNIAGAYRNWRVGYQLAETYVDKLVDQTNERAQFVIPASGQRVFLFRRTRLSTIRTRSRIGANGPLHDTAGGKALLAEMDDERVHAIVDRFGLPASTDYTITDRKELFGELELIRERGYSISKQEAMEDYNGVSSAVKDEDQNLLGALSVSGPRHRLKEERLHEEISELVVDNAEELEIQIRFAKSDEETG
jgi:DNA-binding IclR family transcriptional regulator